MLTIALTGARGYLASLIRLYNKDNYEFINVISQDLDLSDPDHAREYFEKLDFDMVFHAAARPKTEECEAYPEWTRAINALSPIEIAKVCQQKGKRFVFISTEQVYNGKSEPGPFAEDVPTDTVTNYGRHKVEVEEWLKENCDDYLVLRLSSMFGMALPGVKPSTNLISNTLNAIRGQKPTLFTVNELRGMTYAQRLADQFAKLMELPTGIYHFTSENHINTYEIAKTIARGFGYDEETIARYILPNHERYKERFRDYRMDAAKIQQYGIELGSLEGDLEICLREFGWK